MTAARLAAPSNVRPPESCAGGIDGLALIGVAPAADRVVVLEREADGIHLRVTARAGGVLSMLLHPLAHRPVVTVAGSAGTFGGGGDGGAQSSSASTHWPRRTGEVRVAIAVMVSTLACASRPPRCVSGATGTRTSCVPVTPAIP